MEPNIKNSLNHRVFEQITLDLTITSQEVRVTHDDVKIAIILIMWILCGEKWVELRTKSTLCTIVKMLITMEGFQN